MPELLDGKRYLISTYDENEIIGTVTNQCDDWVYLWVNTPSGYGVEVELKATNIETAREH